MAFGFENAIELNVPIAEHRSGEGAEGEKGTSTATEDRVRDGDCLLETLRCRVARRTRSILTAELVASKMLAQSRSRDRPPPRYLRIVDGGDWGRRIVWF